MSGTLDDLDGFIELMRVEGVEVIDIPSCSVGIDEAFRADPGDTAFGLLGG